jgi:hypothetical protein
VVPRWGVWVPRLPVLAAAAFAVALIWRLPRLVEAISWNADALAPALIAERAADATHGMEAFGATVLGDISSASTLWFHLLTNSVPGHRALWAYWPAVLTLATALLIGWSCWRLAGRWAGLLGAGLVLAAGPDALLTFLAPAFRGPTWLSTALLAALLVVWCRRLDRPVAASLMPAAIAAAIVGVNLASDPLLALAGVAPLVLAPGLIWYLDRTPSARRVLLLSLGTATGIAVVAVASSALLRAGGYVTRREEFGGGYTRLADAQDMIEHIPLVGKGILALAGAPGMGGQIQGPGVLRWMLAAVVLCALVAALWPSSRAAGRHAHTPPATRLARRAYGAFWGFAAAAVSAGYLLSDIPGESVMVSVPGTRYLVPLLLAAVAVLPVIVYSGDAAARRRVGAGIAATAIVAGGALGLANRDIERAQFTELSAQAPRIADWLEEKGVDRGYASYWSAGPLSYHTGLDVLAVRPCVSFTRETLCPVALNGRRDWYRPVGELSSFVVVDAVRPGDAVTPGAWRGNFGRPAETRRFGSMVVRVYPYDVAERLAPGWRPYPDNRVASRETG